MTDMEVLGLPARRLGNGMVAFGVVGLVVTVVLALTWLGGLVALQDLDDRLEEDRQAVAVALGNTADLMASTATALEEVTGSMDSMGAALTDAADLLDRLASTTASLADSLNVTILGQQPFAGAAENLETIAEDLDTFAGHSGDLAADLETLEPSLGALAADLRTVEDSVSALAVRVEEFSGVEQLVGFVRLYVLLSALLAGWLALLAAGCIWAGRQLQAAAVTAIGESTPTS
jgi:methyl-accepting chemotaxis protein